GWYNANGFEQNLFYNLNANAGRWDGTFTADSGTSLGLRAYSGSDSIQIFIDNQQVLHAEGGTGRWASYIVP
ncbi:hypothetical protein LCGC14_2173770, partial [marine sediment metagenome]